MFRMRLLCVAQLMIESRYSCRIVSAAKLLVWVAVMVMSSAYPTRFMRGLVEVEKSER